MKTLLALSISLFLATTDNSCQSKPHTIKSKKIELRSKTGLWGEYIEITPTLTDDNGKKIKVRLSDYNKISPDDEYVAPEWAFE